MPHQGEYGGTLTPPMPVKVQATGPVRGGTPPYPATPPQPSRAASGGTPGKRPVLGPATHQPYTHA